MTNLKQKLLLTLTAVLASTAGMATPATDMLDKLKKTYPNIAFTEVNETPTSGIYEAVFGKDLLYVESSGTYFFPTMVNMKTNANLGDERRAVLNKVDFSELPLKDAIKTVHGNGKNVIAVFADPNCGYCKKLDGNLVSLKNVTIYTFPIAILGPDSVRKVNAITCANGDKSALWNNVMLNNAAVVDKTCDNGVAIRNLALFQRLGFQGTPSIVLSSGIALKGYVENSYLESQFSLAK